MAVDEAAYLLRHAGRAWAGAQRFRSRTHPGTRALSRIGACGLFSVAQQETAVDGPGYLLGLAGQPAMLMTVTVPSLRFVT
jgi:hypothetical protein